MFGVLITLYWFRPVGFHCWTSCTGHLNFFGKSKTHVTRSKQVLEIAGCSGVCLLGVSTRRELWNTAEDNISQLQVLEMMLNCTLKWTSYWSLFYQSLGERQEYRLYGRENANVAIKLGTYVKSLVVIFQCYLPLMCAVTCIWSRTTADPLCVQQRAEETKTWRQGAGDHFIIEASFYQGFKY